MVESRDGATRALQKPAKRTQRTTDLASRALRRPRWRRARAQRQPGTSASSCCPGRPPPCASTCPGWGGGLGWGDFLAYERWVGWVVFRETERETTQVCFFVLLFVCFSFFSCHKKPGTESLKLGGISYGPPFHYQKEAKGKPNIFSSPQLLEIGLGLHFVFV